MHQPDVHDCSPARLGDVHELRSPAARAQNFKHFVSELEGEKPDEALLVAIAASAQRMGMDRVATAGAESIDDHTGHHGDPFRTLGRTFP